MIEEFGSLPVIASETSVKLKVVNPSGIPSSSHCKSATSLAIGFGFTIILKDVNPVQPLSISSILTNISVGVAVTFL